MSFSAISTLTIPKNWREFGFHHRTIAARRFSNSRGDIFRETTMPETAAGRGTQKESPRERGIPLQWRASVRFCYHAKPLEDGQRGYARIFMMYVNMGHALPIVIGCKLRGASSFCKHPSSLNNHLNKRGFPRSKMRGDGTEQFEEERHERISVVIVGGGGGNCHSSSSLSESILGKYE